MRNTRERAQQTGWLASVAGASGPVYLAIADAIGAALRDGVLQDGEQLPTHRALADTLEVDLTTVTRAYAEARRRGLLDATVGRGTFVRSPLRPAATRAPAADGPVDLGMNLPPVPDEPSLPALMQQTLSRILASPDVAGTLTYRTGAGTPAERAAGASWLRPTLGEVDPARVLVCPGAQSALFAVLATLARAGDTVLTEALTYPGMRTVAAQLGIGLLGIATDGEGPMPDALDEACRTQRPKAFYCIPTIHNPTTVTMPPDRRRAIADVARRHGVPIVEDDAYGLLPSQALPALASFAPELGFHVATVSKVLSPAARVAYAVAPTPLEAGRLAGVLRASVLMASPLLTGLVTAWITDGTAATIVSAIRRECAARQRIARDLLTGAALAGHPEGLHLWLRLPEPWGRAAFVTQLRRQDGLAVVPSDAFAVTGDRAPPEAVRVSLGAAPNRDSLRRALRSLAATLHSEPPSPFQHVV